MKGIELVGGIKNDCWCSQWYQGNDRWGYESPSLVIRFIRPLERGGGFLKAINGLLIRICQLRVMHSVQVVGSYLLLVLVAVVVNLS